MKAILAIALIVGVLALVGGSAISMAPISTEVPTGAVVAPSFDGETLFCDPADPYCCPPGTRKC